MRILFIALVLAMSVWGGERTAICQVTANSVYELDVFENTKYGFNEARIANYSIGLGLEELKRLRKLDESQLLTQEDEIRLTLLADKLAIVSHAMESGMTDALTELVSDIRLANEVAAIVGEEQAAKLVQERCGRRIKSLVNSYHGRTMNSMLDNSTVQDVLKLSEEQINSIGILEMEAKESILATDSGEYKAIESLQRKHFDNIVSIVGTQNGNRLRELVGEPIKWFRSLNRKQWIDSLNDATIGPSGCEGVECTDDGRSMYQMTRDELESRDVNFVHSHLYKMLKSPLLWEELELSDDQVGLIKDITLQRTLVSPGMARERLLEIVQDTGKNDIPTDFSEVLLPHQLERITRLEFQVLTRANRLTFGVTHPSVTSEFQLKESVLKDLNIAAGDYEKELGPLLSSLDEKRLERVTEFKNKVVKVLNSEQIKILNKLKGKSTSTDTGTL